MHINAPVLLGFRKENLMLRTNMLVIRLTQIERATINSLAESEKLPVSTFARRLLLKEADRRGLLLRSGADNQSNESQHD